MCICMYTMKMAQAWMRRLLATEVRRREENFDYAERQQHGRTAAQLGRRVETGRGEAMNYLVSRVDLHVNDPGEHHRYVHNLDSDRRCL